MPLTAPSVASPRLSVSDDMICTHRPSVCQTGNATASLPENKIDFNREVEAGVFIMSSHATPCVFNDQSPLIHASPMNGLHRDKQGVRIPIYLYHLRSVTREPVRRFVSFLQHRRRTGFIPEFPSE